MISAPDAPYAAGAVCDSQVHAPSQPHIGRVGGMAGDALLREMDANGVRRCIVVPLEHPGGDEAANNQAALALAARHPGRLAVMGCVDLSKPDTAGRLATWRSPQMLGVRLSFVRDPNRGMLARRELEWFWGAAELAGVPLMVLAPGLLDEVAAVAARHPGLRLVVDHMGLLPHVIYDDLRPVCAEVAGLASHRNVAVKVSALPCSIGERFPFPSLHEPIARMVDAFGPHRVFWGSDLSRLPCAYVDLVTFFRELFHYPSEEARALVLGNGIMEWLGWAADP